MFILRVSGGDHRIQKHSDVVLHIFISRLVHTVLMYSVTKNKIISKVGLRFDCISRNRIRLKATLSLICDLIS